MRIRGEPNPTRRLEAQGKDKPLRAPWGGGVAARLPAGAAAPTQSASGSSTLSLPVDRVSVQPRVVLPLRWGEERLEAYLQVAVETDPGWLAPGTCAEGAVTSKGREGALAPPGGSRGSDDGQVFRLVLGLSPPHLGPVQVVLRVREGAVSGELLVADAAALRAAEQALPQLKESLGRWLKVAGLKVRLLETDDHPVPPPPVAVWGGVEPARGGFEGVPGGSEPTTGGKGHGRLDLHV